ncbi:hypothetical protein D8770_21855 [Methylobacterium sp. DB1607]|nr:hypothetical protein [Methylobacterium sp. DB1607]
MTDDDRRRLFELRPALTNVLGFYDLLYEAGDELTPAQRMKFEAYFATSAHHLARQLYLILKGIADRPED